MAPSPATLNGSMTTRTLLIACSRPYISSTGCVAWEAIPRDLLALGAIAERRTFESRVLSQIVNEIKTLAQDSNTLTFKSWSARGPSRVLLVAGWVHHRASLKVEGDSHIAINLQARPTLLTA